MHAQEWLEAHRAGKVHHEWAELDLVGAGHHAVVRVSADAARVGTQYDKRRMTAGAGACQAMADALGGLMLTARLNEERYAQATVQVPPGISSLVKPGGNITNTTAEEHSRHVDRLIQRAEGKIGRWLVANVGKQFILDNACAAAKGVNNGWVVHADEVQMVRGSLYWMGPDPTRPYYVPVLPCLWLEDHYCVQRLGGAHGLEQDDYSQTILVADSAARLDGEEVPLAELYTDPKLCGLVTHDGVPLKWARHPGVERVAEIRSDLELPPDTEPAPFVAWKDPELGHGERVAEWMLAQLSAGVCERPDGSNRGPEVSEWLSHCVRDGEGPEFGTYLGRVGANWCAATVGEAAAVTRLQGDAEVPFVHRCSGIEMENDAKAAGQWRPPPLVASGEFEPERGDPVILPRGRPGGWRRHVCVFLRWVDRGSGLLETVGGNEYNRLKKTIRTVGDALGFIEMRDPARPLVDAALGTDEIAALVAALGAEDMARDGNNAGPDGIV